MYRFFHVIHENDRKPNGKVKICSNANFRFVCDYRHFVFNSLFASQPIRSLLVLFATLLRLWVKALKKDLNCVQSLPNNVKVNRAVQLSLI